MAITLSHQSALDVTRTLRCEGLNMHDMDRVSLTTPCAWMGKRFTMKNFAPEVWHWQQPTRNEPLHILVSSDRVRIRANIISAHGAQRGMPAGSVIWLDKHSSVVCPELLFLQMASLLSFPALVMLGMELCGHFSRSAQNPLTGTNFDGLPSVTSVESLDGYLAEFKRVHGLVKAREALRYVRDHAVSAPEAVLATMFGLPSSEAGYGMGPVLLNERVQVDDSGYWKKVRNRYPDLLFSFAPIGLNYDGSKHFDISDLMGSAEAFACSEAEKRDGARRAFREKLVAARAKLLDDNMRDRQLAAEGRIVFPITKEDLSSGRQLDVLARQILSCAHKVYGVCVDEYLKVLNDTTLMRDRWDLLNSLMPYGSAGAFSHGKL